MKLAGLEVQSSLLAAPSPAKRIFAVIWGDTKVGKTIAAAGLDRITQDTLGKRTLIAACEQSKDAGLDRIAHLDIPTVVLHDEGASSGFDKLLTLLRAPELSQQYGGLILDGFSELALHSIQQVVLTKIDQGASNKAMRDFGAMVERDYVPFQEAIRKVVAALAQLNGRGVHVIVTCGARTYTHRERGSSEATVDKIGPAFPGRGSIGTVETLVPTVFEVTQDYLRENGKPVLGPDRKPQLAAFLETSRDGVRLRGDRTGLFPAKALAIVTDEQGRPVSNLPVIFNEHWLPSSKPSKSAA